MDLDECVECRHPMLAHYPGGGCMNDCDCRVKGPWAEAEEDEEDELLAAAAGAGLAELTEIRMVLEAGSRETAIDAARRVFKECVELENEVARLVGITPISAESPEAGAVLSAAVAMLDLWERDNDGDREVDARHAFIAAVRAYRAAQKIDGAGARNPEGQRPPAVTTLADRGPVSAATPARLDPDGTASPKTRLVSRQPAPVDDGRMHTMVARPANEYVADDGTRIPLVAPAAGSAPREASSWLHRALSDASREACGTCGGMRWVNTNTGTAIPATVMCPDCQPPTQARDGEELVRVIDEPRDVLVLVAGRSVCGWAQNDDDDEPIHDDSRRRARVAADEWRVALAPFVAWAEARARAKALEEAATCCEGVSRQQQRFAELKEEDAPMSAEAHWTEAWTAKRCAAAIRALAAAKGTDNG